MAFDNALASIDAEVEMLSGSYREVRRIKAISYLQVICGAERNDPKTAVLSDDQGKADLLLTSAQDRNWTQSGNQKSNAGGNHRT